MNGCRKARARCSLKGYEFKDKGNKEGRGDGGLYKLRDLRERERKKEKPACNISGGSKYQVPA
jgi:hypothetical protein